MTRRKTTRIGMNQYLCQVNQRIKTQQRSVWVVYCVYCIFCSHGTCVSVCICLSSSISLTACRGETTSKEHRCVSGWGAAVQPVAAKGQRPRCGPLFYPGESCSQYKCKYLFLFAISWCIWLDFIFPLHCKYTFYDCCILRAPNWAPQWSQQHTVCFLMTMRTISSAPSSQKILHR